MKKIFQYIMLAVVTIVMASCTSDIEETTATTGKSNVQLVVGEFPAFGDSQTRAIGTPDPGKTSWAEGDELLLEIDNTHYGRHSATFTYNGKSWELTSGELVYLEGDPAYIPHVYYAPNYKWEAGKLVLKEGKDPGTDEYIEGNARITGNDETITVSFAEATRNYSRLRIATMPNKQITVAFNNRYTPAGSSVNAIFPRYTLTSDEKGNAYLYGTFGQDCDFEVKYEGAPLASHTFYQAAENAKSYVLDATVISANSAEEIKSAIEQKVADSKTAIRLNLASDAGANEFNAIREAFEKVKSGTIDLTLIGCKEIPANGLNNQSGGLEALKSITLPDVTKIGKYALYFCVDLEEICAPNVSAIDEGAFAECYHLRKVTLGELTDVKGDYEHGDGIFGLDSHSIENIDLELSEKQRIMTKQLIDGRYCWTPTEVPYQMSNDHTNRSFLGMTFNSITCGMKFQ